MSPCNIFSNNSYKIDVYLISSVLNHGLNPLIKFDEINKASQLFYKLGGVNEFKCRTKANETMNVASKMYLPRPHVS